MTIWGDAILQAKKRARRAGGVSASDWVAASRKVLIEKGISSVKVEPLAKNLGVTPGSFYWHFKNRNALHRALLRDWLRSCVAPFFEMFDQAVEDPRQQYMALFYVWLLSPDFDSELDSAVREWSKTSPLVARLIRRVDANRIELCRGMFEDFGYEDVAALVRARTLYYHQIGYYTLAVKESIDDRLRLAPYYAEVLCGDRWLHELKTAEEIRNALTNFQRRETLAMRLVKRRASRDNA